ncbi:MAG TPA: L,D-transpeptidase family protein [Longimicrobiaceae bacterium]|nr:L,D-transpeptidase family protein [Longimicrobiaceae bacterium]
MKSTLGFAARALAALVLAAASALAPAAEAAAQARYPVSSASSVVRLPRTSPGLSAGRYVVVIDLDTNLLHFTRDRRVLWSAPVGTGTGLRLDGPDGEWDFSTPNGIFHVQYKEENPVWMAPDWYFVENKLPVPPPNDPKRRFPGGLGAAAVYIGEGLAIHGTDKPELLGQRVSHGCIRLHNRDAIRLFHNVQVGTEVVITGGGRALRSAVEDAGEKKVVWDRRPAAPKKDEFLEYLEGLPTGELLYTLDDEVRGSRYATQIRWPVVAATLLRRGVKDGDREALRGLLLQYETVRGTRTGQEYATFLADAFARGPRQTLEVLAALDRRDRADLAEAIVDAAMTLYPGDPGGQVAPWPTRRIPREAAGRLGERGWDAIHAAELDYRDRHGVGALRNAR